jgi:hypothetical protein
MANVLTLDQFQRALPKQYKGAATQEMVDSVNLLMSDVELSQNYRDNLLSYTSVMRDGRFKMQSYIDAVRYVSFKLLGDSNIAAFAKAFPDRYQNFLNTQVSDKDISAYVAAYNKTKLVNLIFEQTIVPSHVLNADLYQKALNTQAELMITARSEKVRSDAANSLLTHLRPPEVKKFELDIGVKQDSTIDELRATTLELVAQQRAMLQNNGMSAKQIAHSKLAIIEGEVID